MTKPKSLLDGIGNQNVTEKYYDDWATNYDITLKKWKYKAPLKAVSVLLNIRKKFDYCLDLACGTGMFGEEIKKRDEENDTDRNRNSWASTARTARRPPSGPCC